MPVVVFVLKNVDVEHDVRRDRIFIEDQRRLKLALLFFTQVAGKDKGLG